MAASFESRAGRSPISIPANVEGPPRQSWPDLAIETLKLVNDMTGLDDFGVDPRSYNPAEYETIGDFLDTISTDFVQLRDELLSSTRKPIHLVVCFASQSAGAGVLSDLTGSHHFGLVAADRLLSATPESSIGRWWSERRGRLIQTIIRLDVRAVSVAPTLSVPVVRRYGPESAKEVLQAAGVKEKTPSDISAYFARSDLGRLLLSNESPTTENRGNPAKSTGDMFSIMSAEYGFNGGRDKGLNRAFFSYLQEVHPGLGLARAEARILQLPIIPDISLESEKDAVCLEFHWRSGQFSTNANRSAVAQYILQKIKTYAAELGWIS